MKTLVFFGSPRRQGDTHALLQRLLGKLQGDVVLVDAYRDKIAPCVDCRRCREMDGCVIRDDMQKVYDAIPDCDNVVIAAPIYFSELPGPLLSVLSRLQCQYSARRFRKVKMDVAPKRGGVILVGGGDGSPDRALGTCDGIFTHYMNVKCAHPPVMSLKTDSLPAGQDEDALAAIDSLAAFLNREKEL